MKHTHTHTHTHTHKTNERKLKSLISTPYNIKMVTIISNLSVRFCFLKISRALQTDKIHLRLKLKQMLAK